MTGLKNILIGVFLLIAFAIIIFVLLFLHPTVGDSGKTFLVRFTDIDKVNVGTRVTYAGLAVGEVIKIEEIPDARMNRLDYNGDVYVYQLTLRVDSSVNIYSTDTVSVRTSGLLGERNIEINPQPLGPGQELILINDEIIYAEPTPSVEETLKKFGSLSKKFELVLDGINDVVDEIKKEKIVASFSQTAKNLAFISEPEKWEKIKNNVLTFTERANHSWNTVDSTLENAYAASEKARTLTDRAVNSWDKVDSALNEFHLAGVNTKDFTHRIKEVIDNTAEGKGTIGHLFVGDDIYLNLKSLIHKGSTVMDDVKQYGVLFHLNKKWQRVHANRMNMLGRLNSPQQFSNFFNEEIIGLNTSLDNVSLTMNENPNYPQGLLYNTQFSHQFADVIRKVETIDECLKMYNEQVCNLKE